MAQLLARLRQVAVHLLYGSLSALALAQVKVRADIVADGTIGSADCGDGQPFWRLLPVFVAVSDFALPVPARLTVSHNWR